MATSRTITHHRDYDGNVFKTVEDEIEEARTAIAALQASVTDLEAAYELIAVTKFDADGTWTPNADTALAVVRVLGAGGGGGGADGGAGTGANCGSGGGAGGYCERWLTAGWGATEAISIGAAGTAGTASGGGNGGNGGNSSVGTLAVGNGGSGGSGIAAPTTSDVRGQTPGAGGAASTAGGTSLLDIAQTGESGFWGIIFGAGATALSGRGGSSKYGAGGPSTGGNGAGSDGTGRGSGGSGGCVEASATDRAGGAGTAGLVIIEEYR